MEDYIHILKNNSGNPSWKAPIWRVFGHFHRSEASCWVLLFLCVCVTLKCHCAWFLQFSTPPLSFQAAEHPITSFLFLFSVKHVSALHCAIKRRQFRRVRGRAECSQLAEYTNLFGAESEGTPTNHFLRTGHSLQGAGRSPASIGSSVQEAEAFSKHSAPIWCSHAETPLVKSTTLRCQESSKSFPACRTTISQLSSGWNSQSCIAHEKMLIKTQNEPIFIIHLNSNGLLRYFTV